MKSLIKPYWFVTVATLFVGVTFTSADFLTMPIVGWKDVCILLFQWSVLMIALWPVIYLLAAGRWLFAACYPLGCFFAAILTWFRHTTRAAFTTMIMDVALDHDIRTSLTLIAPGLIFFTLSTLVIAVIFVIWRVRVVRLRHPLMHAGVAVGMMMLIFNLSAIRGPVSQRIPFNLYYVTKKYVSERKTALDERTPLPDPITCDAGDDLIVLCVIGEALRADHLAINGYSRDTNPFLSQEDVISFTGIFSEYTYTRPSVAHILTPADSLHPEVARSERSFVDLFHRADFRTAWIANQDRAETYVYFMNECDTLIYVHAGKSPYVFDRWVDGDMLPIVDSFLEKEAGRQLLILHTIGSHWYYNSHYTEDFQHFTPVAKSRIVSSNSRDEMINSYDNTVLYADYFLYSLMDRLRDRNAILFYLSDHGEALGEDGYWLHAADTPPMHHPACLLWMSPQYKIDHIEHYERLRQRTANRYRTDFFFPTIAEAAGIGCRGINLSLSLFQ
jgi:glucan phosphoethanolaminetransferase (alkaline phosphatase superfamily)